MEYEIQYRPAFSTLCFNLEPDERIFTLAGEMVSMETKLRMKTHFSGGFFSALLRSFLGKESLFINSYTNRSDTNANIRISRSIMGDIQALELKNEAICFQPCAYIAHTPGLKMGIAFAGWSSWITGQGLFQLKLQGQGTVFFGGFGGITKKQVSGDYMVNTEHLVAYEPQLKMSARMAGGFWNSVKSGEGLMNRLKGTGAIYLQSRSIDCLVKYLSSKVPR